MRIEEMNFQYSKDQHYRWGWGEDDTQWFNEPDYEQPFKMTFGRCSRKPLSFREECILATQHLCAQAPDKHVYVGFSGGLDSQVVCLTLMELGIKFTPCIIVMSDNYNLHDVMNAKEFCDRYGLQYKVFKVDMLDFYSNFCPEIVKRYKITNARTILQLWLEQFTRDGIFIMGGGDLQLSRYRTGDPSYQETNGMLVNPLSSVAPITTCTWGQKPTPIMQHLIDQGTMGTTKFFMYTPEQLASVVLSPEVEAFVGIEDVLFSTSFVPRKKFWMLFNNIPKSQLYLRNWPEIIVRPKYHGFEFVEKNREYLKMKQTAIKEYSKLNARKGIYIEYSELRDYFSTDGPVKTWYSNPIEREDNSVRTFIKNIVLRDSTQGEFIEADDPLDDYDAEGIDI